MDHAYDALASTTEATPLNEPEVRVWELNENSTRYDRLVAAPSDEDIGVMWASWAGITLVTGLLTTAIFVPLLMSRNIRKNPFNMYLLFLLIPDMLFNWLCFPFCLSNALVHNFTSSAMCQFQSFYSIACICANSTLNALVARQLYDMLGASRTFRRYKPPTHRRVALEALCVYLYSALVATLSILPAPNLPLKPRLIIGAACLPMDYDTTSTIFFYCVFFPLLFGIPFGYVCWVAFQVWRQQLLPQSGRRRILAIYFARLAAVFLVMWVPGILLIFVAGGATSNPWVTWVGGSWFHLQGLVSALVSLLKPDMWKAVQDFWLCRAELSIPTAGDNSTGVPWTIPSWTSVVSHVSSRSAGSSNPSHRRPTLPRPSLWTGLSFFVSTRKSQERRAIEQEIHDALAQHEELELEESRRHHTNSFPSRCSDIEEEATETDNNPQLQAHDYEECPIADISQELVLPEDKEHVVSGITHDMTEEGSSRLDMKEMMIMETHNTQLPTHYEGTREESSSRPGI